MWIFFHGYMVSLQSRLHETSILFIFFSTIFSILILLPFHINLEPHYIYKFSRGILILKFCYICRLFGGGNRSGLCGVLKSMSITNFSIYWGLYSLHHDFLMFTTQSLHTTFTIRYFVLRWKAIINATGIWVVITVHFSSFQLLVSIQMVFIK